MRQRFTTAAVAQGADRRKFSGLCSRGQPARAWDAVDGHVLAQHALQPLTENFGKRSVLYLLVDGHVLAQHALQPGVLENLMPRGIKLTGMFWRNSHCNRKSYPQAGRFFIQRIVDKSGCG